MMQSLLFNLITKARKHTFLFLSFSFCHYLSEMTSIAVHQISQPITCHAWCPDQSMIAFCPNNNEVHIYKLLEDKWEKAHVLQQHDQVVCGMDWSNKSNKIVTASHDRNSYVWNFEGSEWVPTLVVLRLNRAALCVQWSPKENKFAVGSGAKTVCICYYEQENNLWISKLIRKNHDSSVTNVSWHPNNILLATTSTDGKCRIFYTFIKGVDAKDSTMLETKFGELIVQLDLSVSWTFGVKWSPKGKTLAYAGQNSIIYFVNGIGSSSPPETQTVAYRHLPLCDVCFISENMVIGVGFDCVPLVFAKGEGDKWKFIRCIGEIKARSSSLYGSQFTDIFGRFTGRATDEVTVETSKESGGSHDKCINCVLPLRGRGTLIKRFSTSGLDGRVIIWDLEKQEDLAEYILGPI